MMAMEPEPEPEFEQDDPDVERPRRFNTTAGKDVLNQMMSTKMRSSSTVRLPDDVQDELFDQREGFDVWVFLPQLLLRLFPPLMLLQLFPDFRPRADEVALCIVVALIVTASSQSVPLVCASLLLSMGLCQLTAWLPGGSMGTCTDERTRRRVVRLLP